MESLRSLNSSGGGEDEDEDDEEDEELDIDLEKDLLEGSNIKKGLKQGPCEDRWTSLPNHATMKLFGSRNVWIEVDVFIAAGFEVSCLHEKVDFHHFVIRSICLLVTFYSFANLQT